MKKVLITNIHSVKNKGDLGIALGLIDGLKKKNDTLDFTVISQYPEVDYWQKLGIKLYPPLLVNKRYFKVFKKIGGLLDFGIILVRHYLLLINAYLYRYSRLDLMFWSSSFKAFKQADLIISKGGSFFREPGYAKNILPFGIIAHLNQIALAIALGKPTVLSAQSFGPINNPLSRWLLKQSFNKVSLITVRESNSKVFLEELGVKKHIHVVGDSAFMVNINQPTSIIDTVNKLEQYKAQGRLFGCTVRNWSNQAEFINYIKVLGDWFKKLNQAGFKIVFMPQVIGPSKYENDILVSQAIVDQAGLDALVLDGDYEVSELIQLYGLMDYFIATRLHSSIFALLAKVPVLAIAYEPKTVGIFKDLSLSNFVLDIRNINLLDLENKFRQIDQSREDFIKARALAIDSSQKNIDLIYNLLIK